MISEFPVYFYKSLLMSCSFVIIDGIAQSEIRSKYRLEIFSWIIDSLYKSDKYKGHG
jgi:hypothetical protein